MKFNTLFNVFSRRDKPVEQYVYKVPIKLRNRIILFCQDTFSNSRSGRRNIDYTENFWNEIYKSLLYLHGSLELVKNSSLQSRTGDAMKFLLTCKDDEFLDFVEYIFKVEPVNHVFTDENVLVAELNELFDSVNAGFELTEMVKDEVVEPVYNYPFFGRERKVIKIIAYPQVIRKENQLIHATVIRPVLQFLGDPKYKTANQEYLEALDDYMKNDFGDCLTKCCSAFESVIKIVCEDKNWSYSQNDTASTLISTFINKTGLDSFFIQPLTIIATLRNKLSKSHGAGIQQKTVSKNIAYYALNSTASAILLVVNESK